MAMLVGPDMCPKVCSFLAIDPPLHFLSFGVSFLFPFSVIWGHSQWCSGDYVVCGHGARARVPWSGGAVADSLCETWGNICFPVVRLFSAWLLLLVVET